MSTFKITIAYDGTDFVGWQRQASGISIQGLLETALRDLDERDVVVIGAGRTDAGVHALGQVASFSLHRAITADVLIRAVNSRLPDSVRLVAADAVASTFHARFDATRKTYRYRIWNADVMSPFERAYAWHLSGPLDFQEMRAAAVLVEGRRDFAAFQAAGGSTKTSEREVFSSVVLRQAQHERCENPIALSRSSLEVARDDADRACPARSARVEESKGEPLIVYEVTGNGFLRHMVRNIVGSLVEIGRGRRPVEWLTTVIEGRDRGLAGPTAPPHGLVLVGVDYALPGR